MGKKKHKKQESRTDQVRSAVDQAFQQAAGGAQLTRERAQEIADDLASAAGRVRDALDELRPPSGDDVKAVLDRLDAIERRLTALEAKPAAAPRRRTTTAGRTTAARAAARKQTATTTTRKPATRKAAAKPAAAKATTTRAAAKPAAAKPAAKPAAPKAAAPKPSGDA